MKEKVLARIRVLEHRTGIAYKNRPPLQIVFVDADGTESPPYVMSKRGLVLAEEAERGRNNFR